MLQGLLKVLHLYHLSWNSCLTVQNHVAITVQVAQTPVRSSGAETPG